MRISDPSVQMDQRIRLLLNHDPGFKPVQVPATTRLEAMGYKPTWVSRPWVTMIDRPSRRAYSGAGKASLFVQAAHHAYDLHIPFGIQPEVILYILMSEVAVCVHLNPDEYASQFTNTPGEKQVLRLLSNEFSKDNPDWPSLIPSFRSLLEEKVPGTLVGDMLPELSTLTPESRTALLVAFMDVASDFYKYEGGTLCGIPEFKLGGTREDWVKLENAVEKWKGRFPVLSKWLSTVGWVLRKFVAAYDGEQDMDFWRSFFKHHASGSGSPHITGWINSFFAYTPQETRRVRWRYKQEDEIIIQPPYALRRCYLQEYTPEKEWDCYQPPGVTAEGYTVGRNNMPEPMAMSSYMRTNDQDVVPHISSVDFLQDMGDGTLVDWKLLSGIIGTQFEGKFLTPQLGWAVAPA